MRVNELFSEALRRAESGDLEGAEKLYREALKEEELPEIWNNLGNVLRRMGLIARAMEAYERALELDPSYKIARLNLGLALLDVGRFGEALMIFKLLEDEGLESEELQGAICVALHGLERYGEFVEKYRKVKSDRVDEVLRSYGVEPPVKG